MNSHKFPKHIQTKENKTKN